MSRYARIAAFCALFGLVSCSTLPRSGPSHESIFTNAAGTNISADSAPQASAVKYALLQLDSDLIAYANNANPNSLYNSFGGGKGAAPEILVGVGDVLRVTIFESAAGGLFVPADAGSRPGNFVELPDQAVGRNGAITVPYAGDVQASGRSLAQIQQDIVVRLANRAIEPQVVVSFVDRRASTAAVVGEVNAPNTFDINDNGDRVLDLVSRAGGLKFPGFETFITLQRRGRSGKIFFNTLIENPSENIFVAPGDTIYVEQEQRAFTAFGATGLSGEFKFDMSDVSLSNGVGKAGGLLDSRADPSEVFVYRKEARSVLEKAGLDMSDFDPDVSEIPTIYRASLRDPSGFFLANDFLLRGDDVLYISNAESVELIKFLDVLNSVTSTVSGVSGDARLTRNNAVSLSRGVNVVLDE